jgi:hypothetical protein
MKNINKYRAPQDKIIAWRKWANSKSGCKMCALYQIDEVKASTYLREAERNPGMIPPPTLLCNKTICFNAWLHSTTEKTNEKQ